MRALLLTISLLLTACASTQGMSFYSFSNSDLKSVLNQQLPKLSKNIRTMGLPVEFAVQDVNVNIGPNMRDVVVLGVEASANISAFSLSYPVGLALEVEGSPFYDNQKNAIFLRNVKLLDSQIDAAGFTGNLGVLNAEAMSIINSFLAVNPVYKLNMDDPKMALLGSLPLDLKVAEGAIRLIPGI